MTQFATSRDGTRIAYDVSGSGPLLLLVHGLGTERGVWHDAGHVERLSQSFTVAPLDLRGHGESDKPTSADAYTADKLLDDISTIADACGAERFLNWGYSFGATIGLQVAASSARLARAVIAGSYFGRHADEEWLRQGIEQAEAVIQAQEEGRLAEFA